MLPLAELSMWPGGIISWIVVGLVAGWLAGLFMRGGGYGFVGDLVLGLVGALVGGLLFSTFVQGVAGFWGSVAVAFVGACLLVALLRAVAPARRA